MTPAIVLRALITTQTASLIKADKDNTDRLRKKLQMFKTKNGQMSDVY